MAHSVDVLHLSHCPACRERVIVEVDELRSSSPVLVIFCGNPDCRTEGTVLLAGVLRDMVGAVL